MKKIFIVLLTIAVLCGCAGCSPTSTNLQSKTTLPDSTTYIYTAQGFLPLSHIYDGTQLFSGEIRLAENTSPLPSPESLSKIDTSNMYIGNTVPKYYCYNSYEPVMHTLASNGNWDFFPTKVKYEKYSLATQPDRDEWIAYFQKQLDKVSANAPIIFKEAYFFKPDKQGTQVIIVNAGNTFEADVDTEFFEGYDKPSNPISPPYNVTAWYQMSAIFIYQNEQVSTYELLNQIRPVSETADENPYIPLDDSYMLNYYSIQKADNNSLMIYPIYANHITWESMHQYTFNYTYVLADINGDHISELIVHWPIHYGFLQILQINNGDIEKIANITTL